MMMIFKLNINILDKKLKKTYNLAKQIKKLSLYNIKYKIYYKKLHLIHIKIHVKKDIHGLHIRI